jgi:HK97 family phage portal protein
MKLLIQSVILKGNGFAYIYRAKDGTVTNIRYVESKDVTINYNKNRDELYYNIPHISNKRIEPINVIHLIKNSYDGINGISVLSYAARSLGISNNTENSANSFFTNGCNLSGVLTVQGQLTQKQKDDIRSSWNQAYSNGGNGLAVLQGNMSYQPIQLSASDSQMLESRQFNVQDIARFFGISPVLLGDLSHSSYSTIEATQNQFLLHTLQPYITMVENEFNRKLLKPSESNLSINLDETALLKTDKTAQSTYYGTLIDKGILCINEVRKELGYSAIEGGDKHIIPFTDIAQNTINNNTNTVEDEKNIQEQ